MQVAATGAFSIVDMIEAEALCDELAAKWIGSSMLMLSFTLLILLLPYYYHLTASFPGQPG